MPTRPAAFLDRDGTLIESDTFQGVPVPSHGRLEFADGAPQACEQLRRLGYALVMVTNQPDVARGTQTRAAVDAMHRKMLDALPQLHAWKCAGMPGLPGEIPAIVTNQSREWSCAPPRRWDGVTLRRARDLEMAVWSAIRWSRPALG